MKQYNLYIGLCCLLLANLPLLLLGQSANDSTVSMLRLSEDNDFMNITGHSTDKAYTNGTRLDYLYSAPGKPGFFIDRLFPRTGQGSRTTVVTALTETMFTPNDLSVTSYQPFDYPYSTALYLSHGIYSFNAQKKISLQTELMVGIRGPGAGGEQTQRFIHRLLQFDMPEGWDNQLKNKFILNLRMAVERQLFGNQQWLEVIGGGEIFIGNFTNSVTVYPVIRLGKMNPYFRGPIQQFTSSGKRRHEKKIIQAYVFFKPGFTWYASNGMLQSHNQQFVAADGKENLPDINRSVWFFNGGAVFSVNRTGISFNQNFSSALMQHLYAHAIGNVTLYYRL